MDFESECSKLEKENQDLKQKISQLLDSYHRLKKSRKKDRKLIKSLQQELEKYKQSMTSPYLTLSPNRSELSLFSPKPIRKIVKISEVMSPNQSTGKTPQANPDQSVNSDHCGPYIYQGFFIVGLGKNQLISSQPEILFEYCPDPSTISNEIRKVVPELCFPNGATSRKLKLSGSASDLNNVLYSQVPAKRESNCFIFTLRAEEEFNEPFHEELPNSDQELLYFLCIEVKDVCQDNDGCEWVIPKCYVVASYLPLLDLHYEFLRSLLILKRLYRTNLIQIEENDSIEALIREECCKDEILQLNSYAECNSIVPGRPVSLGIDKIELLSYTCPHDLSIVDTTWLCIPLFTSLKFQDFFWLLSAILQEKSVVFISANLGLLSSCVMAIQALLRPFKWPNLMVPIVPNSLRELLEAPIPLIAGVPDISNQERQNHNNIIWVLLDEPNFNRKIQGSSNIVQEVVEPEAPQLKKNLIENYKIFEIGDFKLVGNNEERKNCLKIVMEIKEFFLKIIAAFKGIEINEHSLTGVLVKKFAIYDHKFIRAFVQTLMFHNKLEQ